MNASHEQPGAGDDSPPGPAPGTMDRNVAVNVRAGRERLGWSQADLAARMRALGWGTFHPQTIHRIESGQRKVTIGEGEALARLLGTSLMRIGWPEGEDAAVAIVDMARTRVRQAWREASTAAYQLAAAITGGEGALATARESGYQRAKDAAGELEAEIAEATPESAFNDGLDRWEQMINVEDDDGEGT